MFFLFSLQSCPLAASKKKTTQTTTVKSTTDSQSISVEKTDEEGNTESVNLNLSAGNEASENQVIEQENVAPVAMEVEEESVNNNEFAVEAVCFQEAEQAIQEISEGNEDTSVQPLLLVNEQRENIVHEAGNPEAIPQQCENVQDSVQSLENEQAHVGQMEGLEQTVVLPNDSIAMSTVSSGDIHQSQISTPETGTSQPSHIVIEHVDMSKTENQDTDHSDVIDISTEIRGDHSVGEGEFQVVAEWSAPTTETSVEASLPESNELTNKETEKQEFSKEDQKEENKGRYLVM